MFYYEFNHKTIFRPSQFHYRMNNNNHSQKPNIFSCILCIIIRLRDEKNHYIVKSLKLHSCDIKQGTTFFRRSDFVHSFLLIWKLVNKHCIFQPYFFGSYSNSTSNTWRTTTDNVRIRHLDWFHDIERLCTFHQIYEWFE